MAWRHGCLLVFVNEQLSSGSHAAHYELVEVECPVIRRDVERTAELVIVLFSHGFFGGQTDEDAVLVTKPKLRQAAAWAPR